MATPTITDNRDSVDECRACTITQDCRVRTSVNGGTCVRDRDTGEFGCSGQTEARNGKNWCNLVEPITIAGLEHTFDHCVVHCAAGHEPQLHAAVGPEFYICGPCPDGKRSAHYDKHVCSLCAENQYTDDKETCKDCVHEGALEWVVSLNGRISNDECLPSKCAAGYALQNNACVKCSGTEWSAEGATACVADTVELNGCTLNEHFVPGTSHTEDDGACVKDTVQQYNCVAGEYYQIGTNSADDSACLACANNQHSAANSNSCTDDTLSYLLIVPLTNTLSSVPATPKTTEHVLPVLNQTTDNMYLQLVQIQMTLLLTHVVNQQPEIMYLQYVHQVVTLLPVQIHKQLRVPQIVLQDNIKLLTVPLVHGVKPVRISHVQPVLLLVGQVKKRHSMYYIL